MSSPMSSAAAEDSISKSKSSSPDRAIAFLVHSPESMLNNLPPDCDNKPLARQRRRRTSPDDQKILEDAFAHNPRPTKEERQEIINKVALGDKEVQIWFQNRRQSSRRRSKPLEMDEIRAHVEAKLEKRVADIEEEKAEDIEEVEGLEKNQQKEENVTEEILSELSEAESGVDTKGDLYVEESATVVHEQISVKLSVLEAGKTEQDTQSATQQESQETAPTSILSSQSPVPSKYTTEPSSSQGLPSSQDGSHSSITRSTWFANRRSASYLREHGQDTTAGSLPNIAASNPPATEQRKLNRSGSYLRLSLTEDGLAKVIDRNAPSPPRSQPAAVDVSTVNGSVGLRRSYSATGLNDLFKESATDQSARAKVPRVSKVGRSRDSRAWEFWCDSEARNSLAHTAEQENSGSAADAIGLIRQNSRNALRPNSIKMNSSMVTPSNFTSVNKSAKPKLQRASTTHGRLQNGKKGSDEEWERANGDSDKENWDPEDSQEDVSLCRAYVGALNPRRGRTILGENTQVPSYQTSLGGLMESEKKRRAKPETVDAEVAAFMNVGNEDEDMDAVQSLLRMASGNWR